MILLWYGARAKTGFHIIFFGIKKRIGKKFQRAHRIMARDFTFVITIICKVVRKVFGILERKKAIHVL